MPSNLPPYVIRTSQGVYHFRIVIPAPLRPMLGKREIRRSLRTRSKREAILRAGPLVANAHRHIDAARLGRRPDLNTLALDAPISVPDTDRHFVNDSPTISKLLDSYREKQELEGVSQKTIDDKAAVVHLFIRVVGDIPVSEISMTHAKAFRDTALKVPPMVTRLLKTKTLDQVIAQAEKTISVTTYNNYVKNLSTVFEHAIKEEHITQNPFSGMKLKQRHKASSFRSVFTSSDLQRIFQSVDFEKKAYRRWLPYLGFYTGARLGELCQLYISDFETINGIHCIHIQDTKEGQRLKTHETERLVPIHSRLIELGLLDYVASMKAQGQERLFPELISHPKHGYAATPSKWFGRLRNEIGLKKSEGERKDFHSFRHTVADNLKQLGVAESHIGGILGHTTGGVTNTRYGKEYKPEVLQPFVEMIEP